MARIVTESFQGNHLFRFGNVFGINGVPTVGLASSFGIADMDETRCISMGPFDDNLELPFQDSTGVIVTPTEAFVGFFHVSSDPTNQSPPGVGASNGTEWHRLITFWMDNTDICTVRIDPTTAKLQARLGAFYFTALNVAFVGTYPTTLLANSTQTSPIFGGTLYHVQVRVKLNGASSIVQVKLDDNLVIDWTGTLPGTTMNRVMFHSSGASYAESYGDQFYDSIVINDTTAATCATDATWPGVLRFKTQLVSGAGFYSQFTPFPAAPNFANVDDLPNNADTDYNFALSSGLKDSFPTSPHGLDVANTTFRAWFQEVIARKTSGTFKIKLGVRRSGVDYLDATSRDLGVSYDVFDSRRCLDPSSLVFWTGLGLDSTEVIYQII